MGARAIVIIGVSSNWIEYPHNRDDNEHSDDSLTRVENLTRRRDQMEADVRRVQEFIVKGRTKLATLNMVLN